MTPLADQIAAALQTDGMFIADDVEGPHRVTLGEILDAIVAIGIPELGREVEISVSVPGVITISLPNGGQE
jgi:hypothetical protein